MYLSLIYKYQFFYISKLFVNFNLCYTSLSIYSFSHLINQIFVHNCHLLIYLISIKQQVGNYMHKQGIVDLGHLYDQFQ
jgi:hypothetical protein